MLRWTGRAVLILAFLQMLIPRVVLAEDSKIDVDLDTLATSPEFPAVNNWSGDTIVIKIKGQKEIGSSGSSVGKIEAFKPLEAEPALAL